ncbi:DUF1624 domain-containing protein [Candidatus Peregrinibacteria bacterium]|nr:DUF1624 domain-containing protein [Candidatus Peregrinibacteria bacterium]
MPHRYLFLDVTRGIAVILMILYHIIFDLDVLYGVKGIDALKGFWYYEGRISAILFIGISGFGTAILFNKYEQKKAIQKNIKRAFKILFWAFCITAITFFIQPEMTIHMGILHFLGLSALLSILVLHFLNLFIFHLDNSTKSNFEKKTVVLRREANSLFIIGIIWLIISAPLLKILPRSYQFFLLGSPPETYSSWDYYPLFPWFGIILIGLALGKTFQKHTKNTFSSARAKIQMQTLHFSHKKKLQNYKTKFFKIINTTNPFSSFSDGKLCSILKKIGQKSLPIYLLHQPIILILLKIIFKNR